MKKVAAGLVLTIALLFLSACGESEKSYAKGIRSARAERYEEAVRYYLLAISQGEQGGEIRADLASAYAHLSKQEEAEAAIREAEASEETSAVLRKIGHYYRESGEPETALTYYERSLPENTDRFRKEDLETCGLIADILFKAGRYEEAVKVYNELIVKGYYTAVHEVQAGLCYLYQDQVRAACQYFDMLADNENASAEQYLTVVRALEQAGEAEKAAVYDARGYELAGKSGSSLSQGEYRYFSGDREQAEVMLQAETGTSAQLLLASCYVREEQYDTAEEIYQKLIVNGENTGAVYNDYMVMEAVRGEKQSAEQLLGTVLASEDESVRREGLWNEILILERQEAYEEACGRLKDYLDLYCEDAAAEREYRFLSRVLYQ